ncbi:hypothetical protein [Streptomyces sp. NPDC048481]|uniref:hypothetical protein n=1 Tax=Streptomyces sp. NPDC048481 TaxID=3365557 RepID=UPI00371CB3EE
MQPSRARLGIMASLLGLVAVLGAVWLVRSATTDSQSTASSDGTTGSAQQSNATGDADGDADVTADGGRSRPGEASNGADGHTPGGGKPGKGGQRSVTYNGLHLDGDAHGFGCLTVINGTGTTALIKNVSFRVSPAASIHSDNAAHCHDGEGGNAPPCNGKRLAKDQGCLAGGVLAPDTPPDYYTITAVVEYDFLCDNVKITPCDVLKKRGGPPPTPRDPVRLVGTTSDLPQATVLIDESNSPSTSPSPKSPSPPDEVSPPPVSPSPKSPHDSSPASEEG